MAVLLQDGSLHLRPGSRAPLLNPPLYPAIVRIVSVNPGSLAWTFILIVSVQHELGGGGAIHRPSIPSRV